MSNIEHFIKCPHCGREYLAAEIFYPKYLLGEPKDIERTIDGKIIDYCGRAPDFEEVYKCDKCLNLFKVKASLTFTTELQHEYNELEDFAQPLYSDRLVLKED